jgi:hypothetical protein
MSRRLIIDMGSTSVGGALIAPPAGKDAAVCPHIFASIRREITFQTELDLPRFIKEVTVALKLVVDGLAKDLKGHNLEGIDCLLSSPFYAAQTRSTWQTESKPFAVTPKVVASALAAESQRVLADTSHQIIEQEILEVKLNGYWVVSPYQHHHRAQELEVINYLSLGSTPVLEQFKQVLVPLAGNKPLRFHSSALVFYRVFRRLFPTIKNFVSLEVGGEITEVSLVWGGLIWETMSFPWGHHTLMRKLMTTLKLDAGAAFSALALYLKQAHNEAAMQQISAALSVAAGDWKRALAATIKEFSDYQFLPENMLLVADGRVVNLFKAWLEAPPSLTGLPSSKPVRVQVLAEEVFKNFCHDDTVLGSDLNLLAGALFVLK